jgi:hypothetical protein
MSTTTEALPDAWQTTTYRGPVAVRALIEESSIGRRLRRYVVAEAGEPKMDVENLLEDARAWSRKERLLAELAVHLFNARANEKVNVARMAGGLDHQNWQAVRAALGQYRSA